MTAARLLRYASYLSNFNYIIQHRKNEDYGNVDYLSRCPLPNEKPDGNQALLDREITEYFHRTLNQILTLEITSASIAEHTATDPELSKLLISLRKGENPGIEYTIQDNIIFKGNRVYIPVILRPSILSELYSTHVGMTKMKQLARRYCYWPSIDVDINKMVKACEKCSMHQKAPTKVPLHRWEQPQENFDRVHIDFAGPREGYHFLIMVDAKSKWPEIRALAKAPNQPSGY